MSKLYANVAVPRPLHRLFSYRVPQDLVKRVLPGQRVLVPFGGPRRTTGIIVSLFDEAELDLDPKDVRPLDDVLDHEPAIPPSLLELCLWVADYYLAGPGEALHAALPPGLHREGKELWSITPEGRKAIAEADRREEDRVLLELLYEGGEMDHAALRRNRSLSQERLRLRLSQLEAEGLLQRIISLRGARAQPKTRWMVEANWPDKSTREDLVGLAGRSKHRQHLLEALYDSEGPLPRPALLEKTGATRNALAQLLEQGLVRIEEEEVLRAPAAMRPRSHREIVLNDAQSAALDRISAALHEHQFRTFLLQGVTGSGKTEVYLRALKACLEQGRGGIVLVPEIGLTPMLFRLFKSIFGERVALLHSGLSLGERYDEWRRVRRGEARIVVGARSAIFAPVSDLGLIVVDEEQDTSYKQESAPRYNGRDVAVMRARMADAVCVLASATPSLESAQRAESGKYERLMLPSRASGKLPEVEVVDMAAEFRETHEQNLLSRRLKDEIAACCARGEQAILLLNRRGWAYFVLCRECGEARLCPHCSVALAVHEEGRQLLCHYCDHRERFPESCSHCGGDFLQMRGEGTERLEQVLREELPQLRTARLDRDVVRKKGRPQEVLSEFEAHRFDVLLGTQMVAKGHDFPNVTLVGVLSADQALGLPDFRAGERTFQLLTQVAGRSGRGEREGRVLVQAFDREHYALISALAQDFTAFYDIEIEARRRLAYPPFTAMIQVIVKDPDVNEAYGTARDLADYVRQEAARTFRVLGPAIAPLAKVKDLYRFQVILRGTDRMEMNRTLRDLLEGWERRRKRKRSDLRRVEIDVDPLSLL